MENICNVYTAILKNILKILSSHSAMMCSGMRDFCKIVRSIIFSHFSVYVEGLADTSIPKEM